ncbi:hypothetical protein TNCV_4811971 [Trichonephila clavipes]|nr:hypothetical protein TNCV_4811971 [Trichonephila clavipes]
MTQFHPNFAGEQPGVGQGPPTSLPSSREDMQLDGHLEYLHLHRHYTFTNIHAFSGIRTQALRHISQCH